MLTEEQRLIRDTAAKFAREFLRPNSEAWAEKHSFPTEALKKMGALGLMGMLIPEKYQGSNIGYKSYALAIEEIAYGDASTSTIVSVHNGLVSGCITHFGTEQQKETFLNPMATAEKIAAFCLTEPEAGSDAANIKTRATLKNNSYLINGTKQFITSGKDADISVVFALTDPTLGKKGISAFIVPTNTPGYKVARIEEKMGQEAAVTVQLNFDNLEIPKEYLLGAEGEGYKIALSQLECGRIGIAAQAIGIARHALHASLEYARERVTFGKALIQHQGIGFQLAEMSTLLEAARQLTHYAADLKDQGLPCIKEAAQAKLFAADAAEKICRMAIQILGGYGYMRDYPVERLYRDVRVCSLYEGTSEIQKILISRELQE